MTAEDRLQIACVQLFRYQHPDVLMIHVKNGGSLKSAAEGAKFKRMGVVAGVADLLILRAYYKQRFMDRDYHGLFVELKNGNTGRQSPKQKEFQAKVEREGYKYAICRSVDEFMDAVNDYLK